MPFFKFNRYKLVGILLYNRLFNLSPATAGLSQMKMNSVSGFLLKTMTLAFFANRATENAGAPKTYKARAARPPATNGKS